MHFVPVLVLQNLSRESRPRGARIVLSTSAVAIELSTSSTRDELVATPRAVVALSTSPAVAITLRSSVPSPARVTLATSPAVVLSLSTTSTAIALSTSAPIPTTASTPPAKVRLSTSIAAIVSLASAPAAVVTLSTELGP